MRRILPPLKLLPPSCHHPGTTPNLRPCGCVCEVSPISGTDNATVMATQTKKAGRRICENRPFVFLLAQWNLLMRRPWN